MTNYMTANDYKVKVRNDIISALESSIDNMFGDCETLNRLRLRKVLSSIMQYKGYMVELNCKEEFEGFNEQQTEPHIKITEVETGFFIRFFKVAGKDIYRTDISCYYDLMTEAESRAEYESEMEGERAMNMWANGYRPHLDYMDDPRGY